MKTRIKAYRYWAAGIIVSILAAVHIGCSTPQEAVLEGTWELTTEADEVFAETFLTFNRWGKLTRVTIKKDEVMVRLSPDLTSQAAVSGDSVMIDTSLPGCHLVFDGTLNDDKTVIDGTVSLQIDIPMLGLYIEIDQGTATLEKK